MITPSKVADKIVDTTFDENSNNYQSGESVDIGQDDVDKNYSALQ